MMEALYSILALSLSEHCPSNFEKAWINAVVEDDFSKQRHTCLINGETKYPDIPTLETSKLGDALREIRKQMTIPGQKPWSRCTFTLFPDGKFKFDVEYDD
jgi:hypothetical protein